MHYDIIVDANNKILGRLASYVAKQLLRGIRVAVVNAEKAVISGDPNTIVTKYVMRRSIKGRPRPERGPKWPKTPDRIVWKAVRGMLPMKKAKGREALRKLRVFIGVPEELQNVKFQELAPEYSKENLKPKKKRRYITVYELSKNLGWRGEVT